MRPDESEFTSAQRVAVVTRDTGDFATVSSTFNVTTGSRNISLNSRWANSSHKQDLVPRLHHRDIWKSTKQMLGFGFFTYLGFFCFGFFWCFFFLFVLRGKERFRCIFSLNVTLFSVQINLLMRDFSVSNVISLDNGWGICQGWTDDALMCSQVFLPSMHLKSAACKRSRAIITEPSETRWKGVLM